MANHPPVTLSSAVADTVRNTIYASVHAWAEEITATELKKREVRNMLRPLLVEVIRRELESMLRPPRRPAPRMGRTAKRRKGARQ